MKQLERIELINKIACHLQDKMTFNDIKSYLGGFNINCINHTPKYNGKRVFAQEVLANETSEVISKIANDLNLKNNITNNKHIENFIKNKCDEIPIKYMEDINKFLPFYSDIVSDDLTYLFSYLHYRFNDLFQFLNDKILVNHHYNADASRELISIIDLYKKLNKALDNSQYIFKLDSSYLKILNICETFLEGSGGSPIPEDFNKIEIIEIKPIFNLINLDSQVTTEESIVQQTENIKEKSMNKIKNKVFIVHGHDNETKQEVARFIENIGLETIILHEQASRSMTIIEKIEHYTDEANFAIILYTPCDKGRGALETKVHPRDRARQNVVFEHGYLMAKIGRKNVCALVKGEIETPSDISGVVYTPLDSSGGWKQELKKELKVCGYEVKSI